MRIEDYGLIGNLRTAALVGRNGSLDWLCLPRFDSDACFAALLGDERHGRWLLAPSGEVRGITRRYRPGTLVLETEFETAEGAVRVVDCMPPGDDRETVVRVVEGMTGSVPMRMQLVIRLNYGSTVPWVTGGDGGVAAMAGPDALRLSDAGGDAGRGLDERGRVHRSRGRASAVRARLAPVAPASAGSRGRVPRGGPDPALLGAVVGALHATTESGGMPS